MSRFRRRGKRFTLSMPEVSLTPLIDTALTLLIIFMVTAHMFHNSILIQLPKGHVKEDREAKEELVVALDKQGSLYFEGKPITQTGLIKILKQKLEKQPSKPVFVQGDQGVEYGKVIDLVDMLKIRGGVEYVALSTEKAKS
ncbi:biopolymer transporter ExbD [bacterium]|jgi:biopolymer transport protein TolR|nr:biopolymer transporter ExbD [bacterium]